MNDDDSGQYDARKLRKGTSISGTWVTIVGMCVAMAVAWGTDTNRLTNGEAQSQRIESHVSADDQRISADEQEIAVLKAKLQYIIEQLQSVNAKLDRAEEERRK